MPQRRNRAERRSEAGEIRSLRNDILSDRTKIGIFIYMVGGLLVDGWYYCCTVVHGGFVGWWLDGSGTYVGIFPKISYDVTFFFLALQH